MSKFVCPFRFTKVGHILAGGAALALMLAACSPAATANSPTTAPLASAFPTSAATEALTTDTPAAATQVSTRAATENATSAATSMPTENATSAATALATVNATAAGTQTANAPLLVESDKLLGMSVFDTNNKSVGTIVDVLVTTTGTVQSVVLDVRTAGTPAPTSSTPEATSASATEAATSAATTAPTSAAGTGTQPVGAVGTPIIAANANTVAVDWSMIKADATTKMLVFQGAASELASMPKFDESMVATGYVVRAQITHLPAKYDGLIRLGGNLKDIDVQTPSNEKLGAIQHVIIDMHTGMATYAVVDFGGFLGVGTQSVLVPWTKLQLDNTDRTTTKPILRLNVTKSSLQSAPKFDESALSFWPAPANNDWDSQIQLFWQSAAS